MVISMSRPWHHPETGVWYFRGRVPAGLKNKLAGQKLPSGWAAQTARLPSATSSR